MMVNLSITLLKEASGIQMVQKVTMTATTDNAVTSFVYYEKATTVFGL